MMRRFFFFALVCLVPMAALVATTTAPMSNSIFEEGSWKLKIPEKQRLRQNPFEGNSDAVAAGSKLFQQNCAQCHGGEASGRGKKPSLRTDRVRMATPGELEWLLKNGSLKYGMPSWSRLPEQQRWQIVSYLKSLQ
ncbi:MAG TPA: cytochrome c [Candidatus Angelobacter sp.]|nr:cytochrome c [Candidatus Angelobacter sp.]